MKLNISVLGIVFLSAVVFSGCATHESLIPAPLKALLPKIASGMTHEDMKAVLSTAYPELVRWDGPWSGQTGYIGFRLDERFGVMFSAYRDAKGREVVWRNQETCVFDDSRKVRLDRRRFYWKATSYDIAPRR